MYKTDVFWPWVPSTVRSPYMSADDELRYSIRSIHAWWPAHRLWIVSEAEKPVWLTNVNWIQQPRILDPGTAAEVRLQAESEYNDLQLRMRTGRQHSLQPETDRLLVGLEHIYNFVEKETRIKLAIERAMDHGIGDPFLYINDDQYLLGPMAARWIWGQVAHQSEPNLNIMSSNLWMQMTIRTLSRLRDEGRPYHNWCTHMPWLVDHKSYRSALGLFGHRLWQLESGVKNVETRCWPVFLTDIPGLRLQFTQHQTMDLEAAQGLTDYTAFLNHNDQGAHKSWPLLRLLFPDPSPYELPDRHLASVYG
jgi:hypothetical protein